MHVIIFLQIQDYPFFFTLNHTHPLFFVVRTQDSSGFEHVFVGETRGDKEVIGLHNWIQFYLQEKRGNIDYKGFLPGPKVCFCNVISLEVGRKSVIDLP